MPSDTQGKAPSKHTAQNDAPQSTLLCPFKQCRLPLPPHAGALVKGGALLHCGALMLGGIKLGGNASVEVLGQVCTSPHRGDAGVSMSTP